MIEDVPSGVATGFDGHVLFGHQIFIELRDGITFRRADGKSGAQDIIFAELTHDGIYFEMWLVFCGFVEIWFKLYQIVEVS